MAWPMNREHGTESPKVRVLGCVKQRSNWPAGNGDITDQRKFPALDGISLSFAGKTGSCRWQSCRHSKLMCETIDGAMMKQQEKHRRCLRACCSDRPNRRSLREILRIDSTMVGPGDDLLESLSHFSLLCLNAKKCLQCPSFSSDLS